MPIDLVMGLLVYAHGVSTQALLEAYGSDMVCMSVNDIKENLLVWS